MKIKISKYFLLISFTFISLFLLRKLVEAQVQTNTIIINEAMPNPVGSDTIYEWIELYNYGTQAVVLNNWTIDGSKINALTIQANSFAVISRNPTELKNLYPQLQNIIQASFSLNNSSDSIILKDINSNIISTFDYSASTEGISLERKGHILTELQCLELANGDTDTIEATNKAFDYNCWPPLGDINAESIIKNILFSTDNINFVETVTLPDEIEFYVQFNLLEDFEYLQKYIKTTKLFVEDNTEVTNPISLTNYLDKTIKLELTLANDQIFALVSAPVNIVPNLEITEFKPSSSSTELEWVEFYNPNNFDVDIANYYLTNASIDKFYLKDSLALAGYDSLNCSNSQILTSGQYCLLGLPDNSLWLDSDTGEISLNVFDLNLDKINYAFIEQGSSYSFIDNIWISTSSPTPGLENIIIIEEPTPTEMELIITELYANPTSSDSKGEWIEIFNYGLTDVDLSGLFFSEELNSEECTGNANPFFAENILKAQSYLVIYQSNLGVTLNNSGDQIYLCNKDKSVIDSVEYAEISAGESHSRLVESNNNYSAEYNLTSIPTPGAINQFDVEEVIQFISIKEAKALENNSIAYIKGAITVGSDLVGNEIIYIQDNTAGLKIDLPSGFNIDDFKLSRVVGFKGKLSESYKERKLIVSSLEDIFWEDENGNDFENIEIKENPIDLLTTNLEIEEGSLIYIEGVIEKIYSTSFDIKDINGKIIRIAILNSTNITLPDKAKGDLVKVKGILGQYNDIYRVLPRYSDDIIIEANETAIEEEVKAAKTPAVSSKAKSTASPVVKSPVVNTIDTSNKSISNKIQAVNYRMPSFNSNTLNYGYTKSHALDPVILLIIFILLLILLLAYFLNKHKDKGILLIKYMRERNSKTKPKEEFISLRGGISNKINNTDK